MFNGFFDRVGLTKHNHSVDRLAEANALLNGIALYPLLFKIIRTGNVSGLEPTTFLMLFIANCIWIAYGLHRRALPVLISSSLVLVSSGTLFALSIFWE